MATLDANIILGGKPAQIESPVNALAKMLQIQEAQQGNQIRGMQMQDAQTARERGNRLSALLGKQYATPEEREGALLEGGFMDEAGKLSKNRLEATKQKVELDEKTFKVANDRYGVYKKTLGALANSPNLSKGLVLQAGQELVDAGVLPAEMFAKVSQGLSDDPTALKADLQRGVASQMTPEQMFTVFAPKPEKMDDGASIGFRDTNPNSPTYGQSTAGAAIQKQQSPDSIASNATQIRGQNMIDSRAKERLDFDKTKPSGATGAPAKPMPATALRMQNEALDMIGVSSSINADLGKLEQQISSGKLAFGPVKNITNNLKNMAGVSSEESRNFATFKATLEKLRNDSLRLNKGVQTDGDAQRAWNELFNNINDTEVVKQRLAEIKAINSRAVDLRKLDVENIRSNYNQPSYDYTGQTSVPAAVGAGSLPNGWTVKEKP